VFGAFRSPALYVCLAVACALVLFLCGVGNPSFGRLCSRDSGLDWYRREGGLLAFEQSSRTLLRAEHLARLGDVAEARRWFGLAADSLARGFAAWGDSPVVLDLALARVRSLLSAGRVSEAQDVFGALESEIAAEPRLKGITALLEAELDLLSGNVASGRRALSRLISAADYYTAPEAGGSGAVVDRLMDMYSRDRREAMLIARVRGVCGTELNALALRHAVADFLRQQRLVNGGPVPAAAGRREGGQPRPGPGGSDREQKRIKVRRFDDPGGS
jgi:hypothetical protein